MSILTSLPDVNLPHNSLILLGASILLSFVYFSRLVFSYVRRPNYPTVVPIDKDIRDALEKGVAKYRDTPFYLPTKVPVLILPESAVDDIKKFPDSICNFTKVIQEEFHKNSTGFGQSPETMISVVKNDLTRNIPNSLAQVQDELNYSFDKEFGPCNDWNSFTLYQNVARIVALISGRVFVGRPLSRNDEWLELNINYTFQVMIIRDAMRKWPKWTRDIVGPYLKEVKSLKQFRKRAFNLITPLIDAHLTKNGNEKLYSEYGDEEGNTISWLLSRMGPNDIQTPQQICDSVLNLSFASIHTTSNTVIQAIFDLASYREYIPILLEEIQQVIQEDKCQTSEGRLLLPKSSLARLSKLDSFLKESQRMNNLSLVSHSRVAVADFRLSNGCFVPKGTRIAIPSWVIHNESTSLTSPGHTKPLSEFDGLRYHNLRRLPGNENRYYFVSTSPYSLSFGHGNHACPGRFFASNEIKVILLEFLRNWEFRFPDDEKLQGGAWRRPKNTFKELECVPDVQARVELKRKSG